jgi:hypothetical protein
MTRMAPQNLHTESTEYKSLGLGALLDFMHEGGKYAILDLGQALGVNVDFWSRYPCRLFIEDFYRSYRAAQTVRAEGADTFVLPDPLPLGTDTVFDIILAWDLLNYLSLEEIDALIGRLRPHCRPGTFLFALISTQAEIPEEPNIFRIIDRERMVYEFRTQKTRSSPRYHPKDLTRLLAPFEVSRSFLLRNGIQEYVFVYK